MRITIISSRFHPQLVGSGVSAFLMAKGLAERSHEVTVLTDGSIKDLAKDVVFPFKVKYIDNLEEYSLGHASFKVPTEQILEGLIKSKPEVIHVCNFMPMLLVSNIRELLDAPIVFTFYNTPNKQTRAIGYFSNADLDVALARSIIKSNAYDKLIAGSEHYRSSALYLGADPEKVLLSYLGTDNVTVIDPAVRQEDIFNKYIDGSFSKNDRIIMLPGRVVAQKGTMEAVEAMGYLPEYSNVKLLITGMATPFDRVYAAQVMKLAVERGLADKIIIPKMTITREHLGYFYEKATVVVVPSYYEGLGLAAIEALTAAKPLVTTSVPGLREVAVNDFNAVVVNHANAKELARGIRLLLEHPEYAKKLATQGKTSVQKFSENNHLAEVESTYEQLVKEYAWKHLPQSSRRVDLAHV